MGPLRTPEPSGHRDGAFGLAQQDGRLLLVLNKRVTAGGLRAFWDLPGGTLGPGEDLEHGLAREWREETGLEEFEKQSTQNVEELLSDPEKNIQIGCWYLEQMNEKYRDNAARQAMALAAYNAGPTRVDEWIKDVDTEGLTEKQFIELIKINSTKNYVRSILRRYREEAEK